MTATAGGRSHERRRVGEIFGEVRDEMRAFGHVVGETFQPGGEVAITSRARTRTNGPLRFHTDRTDLLSLLCARQARAGGANLIASSVTIHNEILARRPDLLDLLFADYHHVPQDQDGEDNQRHYALPVFAIRDGCCSFLGASPELLVGFTGGAVSALGLAGSAQRGTG